MKEAAIGIFDSGIGGLTVMKEISHRLPQENIIYFGDTARMPYGCKSKETIFRYPLENALYLIEKKVKILIIACNTSAAYSLDRLSSFFNIPLLSVIQPGFQQVLKNTKNQRIGIIGTKATIDSQVYQKGLRQLLPHSFIAAHPCPLLAPLVEESFIDHPAAKLILEEYLAPFKREGIDTLLLACTHYPLLEQSIQQILGPQIVVVNPAPACAQAIETVLKESNLLSQRTQGTYQYFVSDAPDKFQIAGEKFLGVPIPKVEKIARFHD